MPLELKARLVGHGSLLEGSGGVIPAGRGVTTLSLKNIYLNNHSRAGLRDRSPHPAQNPSEPNTPLSNTSLTHIAQSESEPKRRSQNTRKRIPVLCALVLVMLAAVSCVNDLTPSGGWSGPVVEDGKLFIGNLEGNLVRVDAETNDVDSSWRYPFEDGLGAMYSNAIVDGDNIFGVGYTCRGDNCEGEIFGLRLADAKSIWGQRGLQLETKLIGDIGISGDTLLVGTTAIGNEEDGADGYLYALSTTPGTSNITKWRFALDANAFSGVAIDGSTVYIASMAGTLYAIDISDSEAFASNPESRLKWTFTADGAIAGPILADSGNLYFGDLAGKAYKINPASRSASSDSSSVNTGSGEWEFDAGAWVWAKPVIENGVVYVAGLDGSIFALDETSGIEKWSAEIDGQVVSSPVLFDRKRGETHERALAVPSAEENVAVISIIDGRALGKFITNEPVKSTPLVYGDNLYVHAMNGDLKWFSVDDLSERGCVDLKGGGRCD
jgi:outer membrane protein assembly factor BamB